MIRRPHVLLDDARNGRLGLFEGPCGAVTAWGAEEVPAALQALNWAVADGFHAAGYFAYELGYALEPRLKRLLPKKRGVPLLWFGLFRGMRELSGAEGEAWFGARTSGRAYAGPLRPAMDAQAYGARFRRLQDYITAGDVYQVNLTFPEIGRAHV